MTKPAFDSVGFERLIVRDQGTGDPVPNRARLARFTATGNIHEDIEGANVFGEFERLTNDHAPGFAGEEVV